MFFYRDKHKGNDDCVKDLWSGCVAVHVRELWGS